MRPVSWEFKDGAKSAAIYELHDGKFRFFADDDAGKTVSVDVDGNALVDLFNQLTEWVES